jgi:hypothetical protein
MGNKFFGQMMKQLAYYMPRHDDYNSREVPSESNPIIFLLKIAKIILFSALDKKPARNRTEESDSRSNRDFRGPDDINWRKEDDYPWIFGKTVTNVLRAKNYDSRVEKFLNTDPYPLFNDNINILTMNSEVITKSRNTSKKRMYHDPNPADLSYDAIKDADLEIYIDSVSYETQEPQPPKPLRKRPLKIRNLEPTPWDADSCTCSGLKLDDFNNNYS